MWLFCSATSFSARLLFVHAANVFYLYLCIWIAYAECQWLDGLSSPSEFISSIKLSNYLFMSWGQDMYARVWKHAQQCHLALESRGGAVFNIFLLFLHFIFMIHEEIAEVTIIGVCVCVFSDKFLCQIFISYTWQLFWKVRCMQFKVNTFKCFFFLIIRGDTNHFLFLQNRNQPHSIVKILVKFLHSI